MQRRTEADWADRPQRRQWQARLQCFVVVVAVPAVAAAASQPGLRTPPFTFTTTTTTTTTITTTPTALHRPAAFSCLFSSLLFSPRLAGFWFDRRKRASPPDFMFGLDFVRIISFPSKIFNANWFFLCYELIFTIRFAHRNADSLFVTQSMSTMRSSNQSNANELRHVVSPPYQRHISHRLTISDTVLASKPDRLCCSIPLLLLLFFYFLFQGKTCLKEHRIFCPCSV